MARVGNVGDDAAGGDSRGHGRDLSWKLRRGSEWCGEMCLCWVRVLNMQWVMQSRSVQHPAVCVSECLHYRLLVDTILTISVV